MLKKQTYLVPVLAAALLLPASASAAGPEGPEIGVGAARALPALAPPLVGFHRAIRVVSRRLRAEHGAELRRQRRQAFADAGVSIETLESIAACESGGDPTVVSSDGSYRGKYQFDFGTWESVGGSGDPAAAPEREQDYRAALLYSQSGASPWPVCG